MGVATRSMAIIIGAVALLAVMQPSGLAEANSDQRTAPGAGGASDGVEESQCLLTSRTTHPDDDYYADLFISEVVYRDDALYVNGERYPEFLVKQLTKLLGKVEQTPEDVNVDNPLNNLNPTLNPTLNPVLDALLGPLFQFIEELDPENLPVIHFEVRVPTPAADENGVRLAVLVNLEECRNVE